MTFLVSDTGVLGKRESKFLDSTPVVRSRILFFAKLPFSLTEKFIQHHSLRFLYSESLRFSSFDCVGFLGSSQPDQENFVRAKEPCLNKSYWFPNRIVCIRCARLGHICKASKIK